MAEFTLRLLKDEIDADPLVRGYSGMGDAAVASSTSKTLDRMVQKTASTTDMILWLAESDIRKDLDDAATGANAAPRSAATGLLALIDNPLIEIFDARNTEQMVLVDTLVPGTISAAQRDNLLSRTEKMTSRADELWEITGVTPSQVADARRLP
jgi:hypothetical protein